MWLLQASEFCKAYHAGLTLNLSGLVCGPVFIHNPNPSPGSIDGRDLVLLADLCKSITDQQHAICLLVTRSHGREQDWVE